MKEHEKLALVLCLIWTATLLYGEMFSFLMPSLFSCSWPHLSSSSTSNSTVQMNGRGYAGDYVKVAVLADPQESLSRLKNMFGLDTEEIYSSIKVYHLPGNHDIGYASLQPRKLEVVKQYEKEFGSRNCRFMVGKVEFIAVDAQTLDGKQQGI